MNCYCCGKPLKDGNDQFGWHSNCIRHFFGTREFPEVDISEEVLLRLAEESTSKGLTVTGVQKKLSLHLTEEKQPRLTLVNYPTGYILKPQTEDYPFLPESEFLVMQMAKATGIRTVPFALIRMRKQSGRPAYITKRIDRIKKSADETEFKAMEDFCQLENRLTADKYKGSYERCVKVIKTYSENPGIDMTEFYLRILFSFAVGNSDMHLKNFSLIETQTGSSVYKLSEAYDLLPVNVILPADPDQMALTLNGKKRNLHRSDFLIFADICGIFHNSAEKMIKKIVSMKEEYFEMCMNSYLSDQMKTDLSNLIAERIDILKG